MRSENWSRCDPPNEFMFEKQMRCVSYQYMYKSLSIKFIIWGQDDSNEMPEY